MASSSHGAPHQVEVDGEKRTTARRLELAALVDHMRERSPDEDADLAGERTRCEWGRDSGVNEL